MMRQIFLPYSLVFVRKRVFSDVMLRSEATKNLMVVGE
jgi:hypothetical protein